MTDATAEGHSGGIGTQTLTLALPVASPIERHMRQGQGMGREATCLSDHIHGNIDGVVPVVRLFAPRHDLPKENPERPDAP
jgi:hypothetical protein